MLFLAGRARGLAVALVVLVLSAGAALAGGDGPPAAADFGLETAGDASGQTVPVRADADEPQDEEGDEEAAPEADEESEELTETVELDPTTWDNHGDLVSEAAQMEVPETFEGNHGAFVSCVARMNHGQLGDELEAALADLDLTTLTVEDCDGDDGEDAAEAEADAASTSDGPGRSAEAKARKAARSGNASGHGR